MSDFWLNCDSCGRQNVGVTFVNGMRFCAKCYQETFGASKDWQLLDKDKTIAEQRKQIADLEAKLAESENKVKEYATEITRRNTEQLDMQTRSFLKIRDLDTEILKLKQQLAGKEKEIETLKEENERNKAEAENQHKSFIDCFKDKMGLTLYYDNIEKQHNQDKISFAVEQLNLLYKTLTTEDVWREMKKGWWLNNGECLQLRQTIDNQIEELKKEMK